MKVLGLDVGSRSVRGVVLAKDLLRVRVFHVFEIPRPDEASALPPDAGGQVLGAESGLAGIIAREAPGVEVVVVSVPREQVVTRNLEFPFRDPGKIKAVVTGAVEQHLPFPLRDAKVAHVIADPDHGGKALVLAFAIKRADLDRALAPLVSAKVPERLAGIDSVASLNAFLSENPRAATMALLDVGAHKASLEVVHRGRLVFSRSVNLGGDALEGAVAQAEGLDAAGAAGLLASVRSGEVELPATAKAALDAVYRKLVRELNVSILAVKNLWPNAQLESVKLTGGAARTPGLSAAVEGALEAAVEVWSPAALSGTSVAGDPGFAAAHGLALVGLRRAPIALDLLDQPRNLVRLYRRNLLALSTAAAVLWLFLLVSTQLELSGLTHRLEAADEEIKSGLAEIGTLTGQPVAQDGLEARAQRIERTIGLVADDCPSMLALLNQLSGGLPKATDVTFVSLALDRGKIELEGTTDSLETVQKIVAALRDSLGREIVEAPARTENREGKWVSVFRLEFPSLGGVVPPPTP